MTRLDWKRGRFDTDFETNEIHHALRGHQNAQIGDTIEYWRFEFEKSEGHDVYDEGLGVGRVYRPSVSLPCLHVTHDEGPRAGSDAGFYFNNNLYAVCSWEQFYRTGLTEADVATEKYLKDRLIYDNKVFRVDQIHVVGQIQQRDLVVSIEATQVKPDELLHDPQFSKWATQAKPNPW